MAQVSERGFTGICVESKAQPEGRGRAISKQIPVNPHANERRIRPLLYYFHFDTSFWAYQRTQTTSITFHSINNWHFC